MKFAGSRFYPASAAVTLCATSSAVCSFLCRPLAPSPAEQQWIENAAAFFAVIALVTSTVAGFSLLIGESTDRLGTLVLRGRAVPTPALWMGYMTLVLVPWVGAVAQLFRI